MSRIKLTDSTKVIDYLGGRLRNDIQETLLVLSVGNTNNILREHTMCIGSDTEVQFPIKLIVRQALLDAASGVFLVHNHPSDNVVPSFSDIVCTSKIHEALKYMEILLIDHIIVGPEHWYSFADEKTHNFKEQ